jgi:hypothetical protein
MAVSPDIVIYRGYRLNLQRHANGWTVLVYKAEGIVAEPSVPSTLIFAECDAAIAEAKRIIDSFFKSLSVSETWPN